MSIAQMTTLNTELERLSDVVKLSAHVTRILGQNPGTMTLQGTNSYLLQPPSNPLAPIILIDTSSPHTSQQYIDLLFTHLHHLGLESGTRETHFESKYAQASLDLLPPEKAEVYKIGTVEERKYEPRLEELTLAEYGPTGYATWNNTPAKVDRRLPPIEHIIITHRHLDHVGAIPALLKELQKYGLSKPKIWKLPSPDEDLFALNERDLPTTDTSFLSNLPNGTFQPFSPFQPLHPVIPGLMISIIDPTYRHLLKHDKEGKPKWNDVPEIARVSVRCLKTPGHTADSISLVMCEGEKGVFTGDTVLGQGTTIFTDLATYMTSLKTLKAVKPNALYPGHGPHISGPQACQDHISQYISHRQVREDQIIAILKAFDADPDLVGKKVREFQEKIEEDAKRENKYKHEFLSGKPYVEKKKKGEEGLEKGKGEGKGDKKVDEEDEDETVVGDADEGQDHETKDGGKVENNKGKGDKSDIVIDEVPPKPPIESLFPDTQRGIPTSLLCRFIYQTDKEAIISAATRSIGAHLDKLEKEGKVSKTIVRLPKLVEGKILEVQEQEGWWWAGDGGEEEGEGNDGEKGAERRE